MWKSDIKHTRKYNIILLILSMYYYVRCAYNVWFIIRASEYILNNVLFTSLFDGGPHTKKQYYVACT